VAGGPAIAPASFSSLFALCFFSELHSTTKMRERRQKERESVKCFSGYTASAAMFKFLFIFSRFFINPADKNNETGN
jgi:hypothetical protein